MYRQGLVVGLHGEHIEVQMLRHSACSNCGGCAIGKAESKTESVKALNRAGAEVGDYVELTLPDRKIVSAALVAYGIPLTALLGGLLVGMRLNLSDIYTLILALGCLLGSYLFNRFLLEPLRIIKQNYQVVAIKVVEEKNIEGVFK